MKTTIPVIGMACSACSANVERCLNKIEGVHEATVSLPTRTATVDYDESVVTLASLKEAVNALTSASWLATK